MNNESKTISEEPHELQYVADKFNLKYAGDVSKIKEDLGTSSRKKVYEEIEARIKLNQLELTNKMKKIDYENKMSAAPSDNRAFKTLITKDRLDAIISVASKVPVNFPFAELGVFQGGSIKYLAEHFPHTPIFGFDTFNGLPKSQWQESEIHVPGEFKSNLKDVEEYLAQNSNIKLFKGIFPKSADDFKEEKFSFVHCDFDFELGVQACLDFFWPRMISGGAITFDDYKWNNCPGVEKALVSFGEPIVETAK